MLSDQLDRLTRGFVIIALAVIVSLFLVEVVARNILRSSITWVDEVSVTFLGTWFVFTGAAHAMKVGMLISFDYLSQRVPRRVMVPLFVTSQSLVLVFLAVIIFYGVRLSALTMAQPSAALQLPMGVAYLGVVAGCTLMFVHCVAAIAQKLAGGMPE